MRTIQEAINKGLIYNGTTFTEDEALACIAKWQERLRLQDWHIYFSFKRQVDMLENSQAQIKWELKRKTAVLTLMDPIDYHADHIQKQDHECSIVHELLHLHIAGVHELTDDLGELIEEQAINAISETLVALSREVEGLRNGPAELASILNPGGSE